VSRFKRGDVLLYIDRAYPGPPQFEIIVLGLSTDGATDGFNGAYRPLMNGEPYDRWYEGRDITDRHCTLHPNPDTVLADYLRWQITQAAGVEVSNA
jgi:hypothetical protein